MLATILPENNSFFSPSENYGQISSFYAFYLAILVCTKLHRAEQTCLIQFNLFHQSNNKNLIANRCPLPKSTYAKDLQNHIKELHYQIPSNTFKLYLLSKEKLVSNYTFLCLICKLIIHKLFISCVHIFSILIVVMLIYQI